MLDVSDGLLRDGGRIARASGVVLELDPEALAADVAEVAGAVGEEAAWDCVLAGGEEHSLLATFPGEVPEGGASSARCVGCGSTRPRGSTSRGIARGTPAGTTSRMAKAGVLREPALRGGGQVSERPCPP